MDEHQSSTCQERRRKRDTTREENETRRPLPSARWTIFGLNQKDKDKDTTGKRSSMMYIEEACTIKKRMGGDERR